MKTYRVVELLGDGISAELSKSVHTVSAAFPFALEFQELDLSEPNRTKRGSALYDEAVAAMKATRVALKYPTATVAESPNQVLRDRCDFAVIHRPVATIPGIPTNFTKKLDLDIVRIATGGTYDDPGRRVGPDAAVSVRVIERHPSQHAARYAFQLAEKRGGTLVSASKYTIQRATDGLFEEAVDHVAKGFPKVPRRKELFDALLCNIVMQPERYSVIVTPNEYGDFLSDMVYGLIGSIGLGASASYAFTPSHQANVGIFDPAGGTAPDIAGKGIANPSGAIEAFGYLLEYCGHHDMGRKLLNAVHDCIAAGEKTGDLGGKLNTMGYTKAVIARAVG